MSRRPLDPVEVDRRRYRAQFRLTMAAYLTILAALLWVIWLAVRAPECAS
jgi:hypothetical protein